MMKTDWLKEIENAKIFGDSEKDILESYRTTIKNDKDLIPDEHYDLEVAIETRLLELIGERKLEGKDDEGEDILELPKNYNFLSEAKFRFACGIEKFNKDNLPYPLFFRDVYLPKFHPMPYSEIQYPIVASLALINCNAVLMSGSTALQTLPMVICLGLRGSGKTELAKAIMRHYNPKHRVFTTVADTGAGIRDQINEALGDGSTGVICLDNFNPSKSIQALGRNYAILICDRKGESTIRISNRGNEEEENAFEIYGLKILTTIFDLDSDSHEESKEILRRSITLCFKGASPEEPLYAYSWERMQIEYYRLWTNYDAMRTNYFPILQELAQLSPKLVSIPDPAYWQMIQLPIATGVYTGIWDNIFDGINAFSEYYAKLPEMKKSSVKDLFTSVIDQYVNFYYPKHCDANNKNGIIEMDVNRIDLKELREYINKQGLSVSQKDMREQIPKTLSTYGYVALKNQPTIFVRE